MSQVDQIEYEVYRFGNEREPVVVIDGFSGMINVLKERGVGADYHEGGALYPGVRADARPDFLDRQRTLLLTVMKDVFEFRNTVNLALCNYSLVTLGEADLETRQCIPHYDHSDVELVAGMLYLLGPETGGTAFYRHRRTGFETISPERKQAFDKALEEDHGEFGEPGPGYYYGDSDCYELVGEVEAKPDRLALYRGRLLHSGVIPDPSKLSASPLDGRLTVNMFFRGS